MNPSQVDWSSSKQECLNLNSGQVHWGSSKQWYLNLNPSEVPARSIRGWVLSLFLLLYSPMIWDVYSMWTSIWDVNINQGHLHSESWIHLISDSTSCLGSTLCQTAVHLSLNVFFPLIPLSSSCLFSLHFSLQHSFCEHWLAFYNYLSISFFPS